MTQPSDQHLVLGDVPDQVSPDVSGLVSGTAGRNGVGDQLRLGSLAHPAWPYSGTAHEWRGFMLRVAEHEMDQYAITVVDEAPIEISMEPGTVLKGWPSFSVKDQEFMQRACDDHETRYQKLDFGRLD